MTHGTAKASPAGSRRPIGPPPLQGKAIRRAIAVALCAAVVAGCCLPRAPLARHTVEGEKVLYKRQAKQMYVDHLRRFDRVAYVPGAACVPRKPSLEQRDVIEEFGQPEYVRKPFKSTGREMVCEWIYPRHNLMVQWIRGRMAYIGEMTDIERTLLERGWPHFAWAERDDFGRSRQTWMYHDEVDASRQVISFADGRMIFQRVRN